MIPVKSEQAMARMRVSNGMAARVRDELAAMIAPGVSTAELDRYAEERIRGMGATAAFKGYRGYPASVCVSINQQVVHGIPGSYVIRDGDVVSVDVGVVFDGYVGDTATTVLVGEPREGVTEVLGTAWKALERAIGQAVEGRRLGDISHAVQSTVEGAGYSVVREFVGHGIGRSMHEDPQIPNFGKAGRGPRLRRGMTLAIEPMVNLGKASVRVLDDEWTVETCDGLPSVHVEHTVAVGKDRAEILTVPENAI